MTVDSERLRLGKHVYPSFNTLNTLDEIIFTCVFTSLDLIFLKMKAQGLFIFKFPVGNPSYI